MSKLQDYVKRRNELFCNPTIQGAKAMIKEACGEEPSDDKIALASLHKARLEWTGCTDKMRMESMSWLLSNGFKMGIGQG
jgi:hypothetical protein